MKILFTFILVLLFYAESTCQWVQQSYLPIQFDITSVCFVDQNNGYAVSERGRLFYTSDGGNNWNFDNYLTYGKLNSLFIVENISGKSITGYVAGENGIIIKIVNGSPQSSNQVTNVTVNLNSIYFTSSVIGYCCGNSGTILKTTNGGSTWLKLTSGTNYSLNSIYFTDNNTGYAAGGTNTNYVGIILKTTDAGNTWKTQYSGQANRYLYSVHFENSTLGWACGWNGTVLKTTNGGTKWVLQTSRVTSHLRSISFKSLQEGIAVGAGGTIIVTTNGGTNWVKMQSGTTEQLNAVYILGDNTAVAVASNGIFIKNVSGSTAWQQFHSVIWWDLTKVFFTSRDVGWILTDAWLYKTTDGGITWNWKKAAPPMEDIFFLNNLLGWGTCGPSVWKTTDGGDTWTFIYALSPGEGAQGTDGFTSVYFVDQSTGWASIQFDDWPWDFVVCRTTDGGKTWTETSIDNVYTNIYNLKVYFKDKHEGWLAGSVNDDYCHAVFYHSTDGGQNWEKVPWGAYFGEHVNLRDIVFSNKNKGFLVGGYWNWGYIMASEFFIPHTFNPGAIIARTTDGGKGWLRKDYSFPGINGDSYSDIEALNSIDFPDSSTGYCVGTSILKTTDGGGTWSLQSSPTTNILRSVCFTDVDNGWAVGDGGVILKHQKETVTSPINWTSKIKFFTRGSNESEILKDSLIFGQNSTATNSLDNALGETELPPIPPNGTFDVRFILPDDPSISTDIDLRNNKLTSVVWNIKLQCNDFPLKIFWGDGTSLNLIPGEINLTVPGTNLNINMKDTSQVILDSLPQYNSIIITYHSPQYIINEGITVPGEEGWNLISIPLKAADMSKSAVFPPIYCCPSEEPSPDLFGFDGKYFNAENLENGKGYWVKLGKYINYFPYEGLKVNYPINIKKGWNLIGPFDKALTLNRVTTEPAGILTTPFYGFDKGYFSASTLNFGKGYWVKASSDGVLNYNITGLAKEIEPIADVQNNSGKITITDNSGSSSTLFDVIDKNINLQQYEMPPLPPSGIFDARYNSGLMAERLDAEGKAIILNSASYPLIIKADGIDLRISYSVNGNQKDVMLLNGSSCTIKENSIRVVEVKRTAERIIPKLFALHQNYPNPFNPLTKIKFDLPEKSRVNLSIYNILGERITELVNKELEAGYHEIEFNASSLSSGVYFYRIDTEKNHQVKKMMLLK